jgi:serine/threonine-protein kinase
MERVQQRRTGGGIIEGYSILARLGKGGMGAVFKAIHIETGKLVALKILPVNLARNKNYIRRFLREAKSAAQFDHPNLTKVYEVGNYRGIFYFSMEFIDGETLIEYLKRRGKLTPLESLEIIKQVAQGLKHAHEHRIIHRDIKPENIMVARDGLVKLTDMGLAKKIGAVEQDITVTGQVVGTPCYMAPEQITNPKEVDHRVDIYGLGATLYHLVTGRRPFLAETGAQIMLRVLNERLTFEPEDEIPQALQSLILKMTAKSPELRHTSADELIREINLVIQHIKTGKPIKLNMPKLMSDVYVGQTKAATKHIGWAFVMFAIVTAAVVFMFVRAISVKQKELTVQELFDEGERRARAGDWAKALDMFNYALRKDPKLPGAWNNKGTALYHLGMYNEALAAFEEALKLSPDNADVLKNKGLVLFKVGNYEGASKCFESALKITPDLEIAQKGLDLCLRRLKEKSEQ